jgi:hypothetical protein
LGVSSSARPAVSRDPGCPTAVADGAIGSFEIVAASVRERNSAAREVVLPLLPKTSTAATSNRQFRSAWRSGTPGSAAAAAAVCRIFTRRGSVRGGQRAPDPPRQPCLRVRAGARGRRLASPLVARRRAGSSCGSGPAFVSPQAFRAATLVVSGYGGERQLRGESPASASERRREAWVSWSGSHVGPRS